MDALGFVNSLLERIYSGPVLQMSKRIGLDPLITQTYNTFNRTVTDDQVTISIAGAESTFRTTTMGEYRRVTRFIEQDILEDFVGELRSDDMVWDVGANIGLYACLAASIVTEGGVLAIEPHPANIDGLRTNIELNEYQNIEVVSGVLSNESGRISIKVTSKDEPGLGLHSIASQECREEVEVPTYRGDGLVGEGHEIPTVVKIDVEGSEPLVLEGMKEVLQDDRCRLVYCEVHGGKSHPNSVHEYGYTPEDIESMIEDAGFSIDVIDEGDPTYTLRARK